MENILNNSLAALLPPPLTGVVTSYFVVTCDSKIPDDCSGCIFKGSFVSLDLSKRNLRNIDMYYIDVKYANFSDSNLTGANLECANMRTANLTGANLEDAYIEYANLDDVIW